MRRASYVAVRHATSAAGPTGERRRRLRPSVCVAAACATLLLTLLPTLLGACGARPALVLDGDRDAKSLHELLGSVGAELRPLPRTPLDVEALEGADVVVVYRASPTAAIDAQTGTALRAFVQRGGALLLIGYAARLAHEIDLEPEAPDRIERLRHGIDATTLLGRMTFGFRRVRDDLPELTDGLVTARPGHVTPMLGGGDLPQVQTCLWERVAPRRGNVIGRMTSVRDGRIEETDAAVLVHWTDGAGQVLAYGQVPEPWRDAGEIATNAQRFVRQAVAVLAAGKPSPRVVLCAEPERAQPRSALPPTPVRLPPSVTPAPDFGFEVALNHLSPTRVPLTAERVLQDAIVTGGRAGASFVTLRATDSERGHPFGWSRTDPLARPAGYLGDDFWNGWSVQQVQALARAAHERGQLVGLTLDPLPVRGGTAVEQLAALKWFARELADARRLGDGAVDAFVVPQWVRDPVGYASPLVRQYQPHAKLLAARLAPTPGFTSMLDAGLGRPHGLNATGVSDRFRGVFAPDEFASLVVDVSTRRPSPAVWGRDVVGGGNHGDWIVTQVQDFFRRRAGGDGTLVFRALHPDVTSAESLRYAFGLGLDPLRSAVAARHWATGKGGWRDLVAGFVDDVQAGFGAESPLPADTPFLQNNHFRLHGSAGSLWFDPASHAWFRAGDPATLVAADRFVVTEVRGARLRTDPDRWTRLDLLGGGPRREGGFGAVVAIPVEELGAGRFPALLALEAVPRWPRKVELTIQPPLGLYELDLSLRGVESQGVVEIRRDGELLHQFPFAAGRGSQRFTAAFPVGEASARTLSIEVVDGGAVAIEVFQLLRRGELGAEVRIAEACGHRAVIEEVTGSPYFRERSRWITHADLPGFLWVVDYGELDRQLTVLRRFSLTGYDGPTRGGRDGERTEPFVLRPTRAGLPPLAVVPIELPRYHHFTWSDGQLAMVGRPRAFQRCVVGFFWLREHDEAALPLLREAFAEMVVPPDLALDGEGRARAAPLALPWPRVFRIARDVVSPYLVSERGGFVHRGAQIAADRSDLVCVHAAAGQAVEIVASTPLVTRPGPGSLHRIVVVDPAPTSATVVVERATEGGPPPSVTMAEAFDDVLLDGRQWRCFDGRTVHLPRRAGRYRVEVRNLGHSPRPNVARTDADVERAEVDRSGALELQTRGAAGASFVAWIAGPEPTSIDGGERIDESEFTHTAEQAVAVRGRGVLVRFAPGLLRLRYTTPGG